LVSSAHAVIPEPERGFLINNDVDQQAPRGD